MFSFKTGERPPKRESFHETTVSQTKYLSDLNKLLKRRTLFFIVVISSSSHIQLEGPFIPQQPDLPKPDKPLCGLTKFANTHPHAKCLDTDDARKHHEGWNYIPYKIQKKSKEIHEILAN